MFDATHTHTDTDVMAYLYFQICKVLTSEKQQRKCSEPLSFTRVYEVEGGHVSLVRDVLCINITGCEHNRVGGWWGVGWGGSSTTVSLGIFC